MSTPEESFAAVVDALLAEPGTEAGNFLCPFCRQFEERAGSTLAGLVADGTASRVYHPGAFLERLSTAHYPSRASASSGGASDGGRFAEYRDALFANQPEEGGPELSDDELIALGVSVGLDSEGFGETVREQAYMPWTAYLTARAVEMAWPVRRACSWLVSRWSPSRGRSARPWAKPRPDAGGYLNVAVVSGVSVSSKAASSGSPVGSVSNSSQRVTCSARTGRDSSASSYSSKLSYDSTRPCSSARASAVPQSSDSSRQ